MSEQAKQTTQQHSQAQPVPAGGPGAEQWLPLGRGVALHGPTGGMRLDPDLVLPSRGMDVEIEFYYYSQDDSEGPYGHGRTMSYNRFIETGGNFAVVNYGDGDRRTYELQGGVYKPPAGTYDLLKKETDNTWTQVRYYDWVYFRYDTSKRLSSIQDPNGNTQTISWEGTSGRVATILDPAGRTVTFHYDGNGRLDYMLDWGERRQTFSYDADANLNMVIGPAGCVTYYNYDANHHMTQMIDPDGFVFEWQYDTATPARLIRQSRPGDSHTYYNYDAAGRLEVVIDPEGQRTTYSWHPTGYPLSVLNAVGGRFTYLYNDRLRRTGSLCPNNHPTYYNYDDRIGMLSNFIDGKQGVTYYNYDNYTPGSPSWLIEEIDPFHNHTTYSYDAKGNLKTAMDPLGHVTSYLYDGYGQQTAEINALGKVTYYNYDANGNQTQEIDPLHHLTSFEYDALGRVIAETNPLGKTTYYEYDPMGRVTKVTDPLDHVTAYGHDARGNLTAEVDAEGRRTTYSYDGNGNLIEVQDGAGVRTTYLYDKRGQQTGIQDPFGNTTYYLYDGDGRNSAIIDRRANVSYFNYDAEGLLTNSIDARGEQTDYVYDYNNVLTTVIDPKGHRWTMVHDALNRVAAVVAPPSYATTTLYDPAGRVAGTIDPLDRSTYFNYDAADQRTEIIDPLGHRFTMLYDDAGRISAELDANDHATYYAYDDADRQTSLKDARSQRTTFLYDDAGRRTGILNARGHTTYFNYDATGNLAELIDPLHQATGFGYDGAGRLGWRLDAKGQRTTYVYDQDQLSRLEYSAGGPVSFSYDEEYNRTEMDDEAGTTSYGYNELNLLEHVTYPGDKTITYSYDAATNRDLLIDPDGSRTTYSYTSRNLLYTLMNGRDELTTWLYDGVGRVTTLMHYNGTVAEYDYNEAGWPKEVRNLKSDRSLLSQSIYSYDAVGNRIGVVEASGDRVSWTYDEADQLTFEERVGTGSYGLAYTYDGVGNRLTDFNGAVTTTYSYDEADQLSVVDNGSSRTTYSYDENGNTELIDAAGSYTTYTWDIENRPTLVELSDGTLNTIVYDGDGKRRRYADSAGVRLFIWDEENILLQTNAAGATNRDYTYRPRPYGELVSQSGEAHHYDALGSTVLLTDASQDVVASYRYRAFGEQTVVSGSSPNRFTWLGRLGYYRQPDTDDCWVRASVLRPGLGRWLRKDPVLAVNHWAYALNSPLVFADPSGLQAQELPQEAAQQGPNLVLIGGGAAAGAGVIGVILAPEVAIPAIAIALILGVATPTAGPETDLAPLPAPRPCPDEPDEGKPGCRRRHPHWPTCKHTASPGLAGTTRPRDWRKADVVNRARWRAARPGSIMGEKADEHCLDNTGTPMGGGRLFGVKVQFTERPPWRRKPGTKDKETRKRFSVRCCPCCTPGSNRERRQCWNVHASGDQPYLD
jgi:RHS repeat-associated protein